ncbi:hypothetical protein KCU71_g731, partial [Aureobasidium melanogenum]
MPPRALDSGEASKTWKDSHEENCRRVRARLLELNPDCNIFIYWSYVQRANVEGLRPNNWVTGTFKSKPPKGWYSYEYTYFVFYEGTIDWDGSSSSDKLCITETNFEKIHTQYRFQRTTRSKVDWANWMGQLRARLGDRSSQLYLSSLALPATHDSHATSSNVFSRFSGLPLHSFAASFAQCQEYSVIEQLDMGVRSFDFRVGPGLQLRHGLVELKGNLSDLVTVMSKWLDEHDHETILFQAKWDQEPYTDENRQSAATEVNNLLSNYPRAMVQTEQPRLSDCVGRLVLYNDNGIGAWKPATFSPPPVNNTKSGEVEQHCEGVIFTLESMLSQLDVENKLFMDVWCNAESLSKSWRTGNKPVVFAEHLKPILLSWLTDHRGGIHNEGRKARLGRINLDFVDYKYKMRLCMFFIKDRVQSPWQDGGPSRQKQNVQQQGFPLQAAVRNDQVRRHLDHASKVDGYVFAFAVIVISVTLPSSEPSNS